MIVITSMNELPHSCMSCPFQKNQKTPFCRAKRNYYKSSLSNIPPAFGFYIKDDAFLEGQTPWNARAKWCPLIEVADIKTEPTISKMEQVDEPQTYVINPQEPTNDDKCFECDDFFTCGGQCNKIEDEPHTDCPWK